MLISHGLALFFTLSRIAWLGALLMGVIMLWPQRATAWTHIKRRLGLILFGLLALLAVSPFIVLRFVSLFLENSISVTERWRLSSMAITMITMHPLLGVGIGNYVVSMRDYDVWNMTARYFQPAHNLFLLAGSEIGIPGLLALVGMLGIAMSATWRACRTRKTLWPLMLLASWVVFLVLAQFDHYFWDVQQGILLMAVLLGVSLSMLKEAR
jgi:O-antigen ligase